MQSIVERPTPTSCCKVRQFTGLVNYYRRFVEGYAEVAARPAPLTALDSLTAPGGAGGELRVVRVDRPRPPRPVVNDRATIFGPP